MSTAVVAVPATPAREPVSRTDGMPRTAACIAVASWVIVVVSVITLVVAHPAPSQDMWFFTVDAMVGCVYGLVAGVTLSRRRHIVPAIIGLTAIGGAVAAFAYAYGELGLVRSDLPFVDAVARLDSIAWVPGTLALFLVVPWLVRDHPLGWFGRAGLTIGTGVTVLFTASSVVERPISMSVLSGLAVGAGVLTAVDVTWRWACGPTDERPGLGWLAIGVTIMALSFLPLALPAAEGAPIWSIPALHLAAQAFFPAAVLVAVLRRTVVGYRPGRQPRRPRRTADLRARAAVRAGDRPASGTAARGGCRPGGGGCSRGGRSTAVATVAAAPGGPAGARC